MAEIAAATIALLLWHTPLAIGLHVGVLARHTRTGRSGVIERLEARGDKVKIWFEDDSPMSWQRASNFVVEEQRTTYPTPESLRVQGVTLVPEEQVRSIVTAWDAAPTTGVGCSATAALRAVAKRHDLPLRLIGLVLLEHDRWLPTRSRQCAKDDRAFLHEYLGRHQKLKDYADERGLVYASQLRRVRQLVPREEILRLRSAARYPEDSARAVARAFMENGCDLQAAQAAATTALGLTTANAAKRVTKKVLEQQGLKHLSVLKRKTAKLRKYTDEQMCASMRRAASGTSSRHGWRARPPTEQGGGDEGAREGAGGGRAQLSTSMYSKMCQLEEGAHPNLQTLLRRHGSWENACRAAGLTPRGMRHNGAFGASTFSEAELMAALAEYIATESAALRRSTMRGYHEWAQERRQEGRRLPLSGAIRVRLLGGRKYHSWSELVDEVRRSGAEPEAAGTAAVVPVR